MADSIRAFVKARRLVDAVPLGLQLSASEQLAAAAQAALPSKSRRLLAHDLSVLEELAAAIIARTTKRRRTLISPKLSDFADEASAFAVVIKEEIMLTSVYNERLAELSSTLWQSFAALFHETCTHAHVLLEAERAAHRNTAVEMRRRGADAEYRASETERAVAAAAEMRFKVDASNRELALLRLRAADAEAENVRLRTLLEEHISNAQRLDTATPAKALADIALQASSVLARAPVVMSRQGGAAPKPQLLAAAPPPAERYPGSVEWTRMATLVGEMDDLIADAASSADGTGASLDALQLLVRTVGRNLPPPPQTADRATQSLPSPRPAPVLPALARDGRAPGQLEPLHDKVDVGIDARAADTSAPRADMSALRADAGSRQSRRRSVAAGGGGSAGKGRGAPSGARGLGLPGSSDAPSLGSQRSPRRASQEAFAAPGRTYPSMAPLGLDAHQSRRRSMSSAAPNADAGGGARLGAPPGGAASAVARPSPRRRASQVESAGQATMSLSMATLSLSPTAEPRSAASRRSLAVSGATAAPVDAGVVRASLSSGLRPVHPGSTDPPASAAPRRLFGEG